MRQNHTIRKVAPFKDFMKEVLRWHIMKSEEVKQLTRKLVADIRANHGQIQKDAFVYFRFVKYARLKEIGFVYGLALIGWNDVVKYSLMPNLVSYFEKSNSEEVDKIISQILADYDYIKQLPANENFIKNLQGFFVIPKSYYRKNELVKNN